ncbi:MAG: HEAT repeat domain-containing protein [Planctomycetota bacterium]|nr:HEAT repeat domain-containing protein [Planctomycetota bacterium]
MTRTALMLATLLALAACQQSGTTGGQTGGTSPQATGTPGAEPMAGGGTGTGGAPGTADAIGSDRLRRAWNLLSQWDAAQSAGQQEITARLRGDLQQTVDGGFAEFVEAAAGRKGVELQYLATSVLGFSQNPEATRVLEAQLDSKDPNLLANALVALALRRDPATRLPPVMILADTRAPDLPRRYAPLVIATVIDARERTGQPRDPRLLSEAFRRVAPLASDEDAYTRLHVAKAMGAIRSPATTDYLLGLVRDRQMRVRWASAAALERGADPRGFPEVVRLMHEVPEGSKHIIRDILVSYAERIQKKPLTDQEITELGTSAAQWSRWYASHQRATGGTVPPARG